MKKNYQGKKFGKNYFSGYYHKNVGEFSEKDLRQSVNWFTGWFQYLNKFVDFKNGKGRTVLEVGCSIGGASHLLCERGFKVYTSDISKYAVDKAKKLAKKFKNDISFHVFDVEKGVPLKGAFDIIIAFEVVEHLKYPTRAIKNMKTKLKKNGVLICSTPNADYDLSSDPTHISVKSKKEWRIIFKKLGFRKIKIEQVSFFPFFYKFNKHFHFIFPIAIKSKFINSPLFIIAGK